MSNANDETAGSTDATGGGGGLAAITQHMSQNKIDAALWCSRVATVVFALLYLVPLTGAMQSHYSRALLASGITSALRLHQRIGGQLRFSREHVALLFAEDSCHYLLFALLFSWMAPLGVCLAPVVLFALLHATTYSRQLLDLGGGPTAGALVRRALAKLEGNQRQLLRFIAMNEILLMPLSVFLAFTGRGTLLMPFLYFRFLGLRYASQRNPYCRTCFFELRFLAEHAAGHASCPAVLGRALRSGVALVSRLAPVGAPTNMAPPGGQ